MYFLKSPFGLRLTTKILFLVLTILATILFIWPELNFQDVLAQGDHGRDLYAFEAVYKRPIAL